MDKTISKNFRTLTRKDDVVGCFLYGQWVGEVAASSVENTVRFGLAEPVHAFVGDDLVAVTEFVLEMSDEERVAFLSSESDTVDSVEDVPAPAPIKRGRR